MINNVGGYTYTNPYHEGKVGYINKFDKSLKIPFLNVLYNNMHNNRPNHVNEPDVDGSEIVISDNVELSSAVVSMSNIGDQT